MRSFIIMLLLHTMKIFYEWQQLRDFPPFIAWLRFGNATTRYIAEKLIRHKNDILKMVSDESKGVLEIY